VEDSEGGVRYGCYGPTAVGGSFADAASCSGVSMLELLRDLRIRAGDALYPESRCRRIRRASFSLPKPL
jgi:hypothetical protein